MFLDIICILMASTLKPWKQSYEGRRAQGVCWNYDRLIKEILCCKTKTIDFLTEKGLLKTNQPCPTCRHLMSKSSCKPSHFIDEYLFRCQRSHHDPAKNSYQKHDRRVSIKRYSWFSGINITLAESLKAIYFWAAGMNLKMLRRELPIAKPCAIDIYCFLREICANVVIHNATPLGGVDANGDRIIVEIDESKFGKVKYNRVTY